MFNKTLLEDAVANKNKRQQLDYLLRISAPHERIILTVLTFVLFAFASWVMFGGITRSVTLDGFIIKPGVRHEVTVTEPGYLVEFLVTAEDHVKAGEPIARQSVPELDREVAVLRDRIDLLATQLTQAVEDSGSVDSLLASTRVALLQIEARRSAREMIVSQTGGEIMALRSVPGDYLPAGAAVALLRVAEDAPPQAVLRVAPQTARRIQPGMQASVEVVMSNRSPIRLDGEVASVTTGPLPDWLAALPPAGANSNYRVEIVLRQASGLFIADGTPCRVQIVIGEHPPSALLNHGRF